MENTINYIAEYYKNKDKIDLNSFFKIENVPVDITKQLKEIKSLQNQLQEATNALNNSYASLYAGKYTPTSYTNVLRYTNRDNVNYYYLASTGQLVNIDDIEKPYIKDIATKHDITLICDGYSYEQAVIILKKIRVNISGDNTKASIVLLDEIAINVFDNTKYVSKEGTFYTQYEINNLLRNILANEFINIMYGVNVNFTELTLEQFIAANNKNACTEIVLKTAPQSIMYDMLVSPTKEMDTPKPIYKILGVSQEIYNQAIERNIIRELYETIDGISDKAIYGKTPEEWLDLIEFTKEKEEELQFNQVATTRYTWNYARNKNGVMYKSAKLLGALMEHFTSEGFKEYYSFGQFCEYVIDGSINQGFTILDDFCTELRDYLRMCKPMGIKPLLFAGYLRQTHDITARNHKIKVSQEQEEIFKNVYKDYKPVKVGEFSFIAPKTSKDVQNEGDQQSNCVASYVSRILQGSCMILFMRYTKDLAKSFITMEVKDNKIVQVKGSHNRRTTKEENAIIEQFAKKKEWVCSYN